MSLTYIVTHCWCRPLIYGVLTVPKEPAAELGLIGSIFVEPADQLLLEVIEVGDFSADAAEILSVDELDGLKQELACLRQLGSVIEGTGGLRKIRYGAKGKGKRGGARVLYYYGGDHMPIFLIAIYPKSEQENISAAKKKAIKKLINCLVEENQQKKSVGQLKLVTSVEKRRR